MMHVLATVAPPDIVHWATSTGIPLGYLRRFLAGRSEPYAAGVFVADVVPGTRLPRMVVVESDGGRRLNGLRFASRIRVQVWAPTRKECSDLSLLIYAGLSASPGDGPVIAVSDSSGPFRVADPDSPKQFLNFELITRPVVLT